MIRFRYLARLRGPPGNWQIHVQRSEDSSAIFFATTREAAVKEAVTWAGYGDPEKVLEAALEALETALDEFVVPPPLPAASLPGIG